MSGVKGRSGRKTHYDELAAAEIAGLSQKTVREYLMDKTVSLEKRVAVAKEFAIKVMPSKIEGEGFGANITLASFLGSNEVDAGARRSIIESLRKGRSTQPAT